MNILNEDTIYRINSMSTEKGFDIYEACGYLAGILFAAGLVPQVYKSFKTKNLRDISYGWQFTYLTATTVMVIYGVHKELPAIYIPTFFENLLILSLIIMKIQYHRKEKIRLELEMNDITMDDIKMDDTTINETRMHEKENP
ncbi:MAG: hypothetical protein CL470_05255 [Acidimicrobiaceae bacterium]|nr:hypothetical protein [Acidimicrobiaceae bacterium]|tara:strand:- start:2641 stop:3066 length:426 start_codon:yes stop_codon:yes gene_type:complete